MLYIFKFLSSLLKKKLQKLENQLDERLHDVQCARIWWRDIKILKTAQKIKSKEVYQG